MTVAAQKSRKASSSPSSVVYARRGFVTEDASEPEMGYTEYQCTNCGHATPKNTPPCDRCGNYELEPTEVRASDFDDEIRVPGTLAVARENPGTTAAAVVIAVVAVLGAVAWSGVFVVADPTGTYRFGGVTAAPVDDDGELTAGEFRTQLAADHEVTGMHWVGQSLEVSVQADVTTQAALVKEIMGVARSYAEFAARGDAGGALELTVSTPEGRAAVRVASSDARAFAAGDLTESQYRDRILGGNE